MESLIFLMHLLEGSHHAGSQHLFFNNGKGIYPVFTGQ